MVRDVVTVAPEEMVRVAADRIANGDLKSSRHHALPIVDSEGQLQGLVTQGDLLRALQTDPSGNMTVLDAGTRGLVIAYPDERVFDAVTKMLANNIGRLPVVDRNDERKMVGYINRANVMGSWRGHLHEEFAREHGWIRNLSAGDKFNAAGGIVTGRVAIIAADNIRIALDSEANRPVEEFALNTKVRGIFPGDEVRINYRIDKGHKVAFQVVELSSRQ
jgi:CBS domain-containing protein